MPGLARKPKAVKLAPTWNLRASKSHRCDSRVPFLFRFYPPVSTKKPAPSTRGDGLEFGATEVEETIGGRDHDEREPEEPGLCDHRRSLRHHDDDGDGHDHDS
jgi:hypothetical protein